MRPGYTLYRHPTPNDERDGWLCGYRVARHGQLAPEFSLHKSRIEECKDDGEYEELLCESADDLMQAQQDGCFGGT